MAVDMLPLIVQQALARIHAGETHSQACLWTWTWTNQTRRDELDAYLVATKHPLAYEPGTSEQRFRAFVRECATVNR